MRVRLALLVAMGLGIAAPRLAAAADPPAPASPPIRTARSGYSVRVVVAPAVAELGQRVTYRVGVTGSEPGKIRLLPPEQEGAFTWGTPRVFLREGWRRRPSAKPHAPFEVQRLDTMGIEVPLQAFAHGQLSIPGLRLEIDDGRGPRVMRLPTATLTVIPVLTPADSNADFRAVHGPLAAPWWERVPWRWVILGLLILAAIAAFVLWRRRRTKAPAVAPARPVLLNPQAEALAALAALRALNLPEHGRFTEHAFRLGQILRRYLEAVTPTTRPGDTTPELVAHLRQAGLESDDLARLAGLLRVWDQVKFAREPFTLEEAVRAERATEAFLRRPAATVEKAA